MKAMRSVTRTILPLQQSIPTQELREQIPLLPIVEIGLLLIRQSLLFTLDHLKSLPLVPQDFENFHNLLQYEKRHY